MPKHTLSENGTVTRGVCKMDTDNNLITINETHEIARLEDGSYTSEEGLELFDDTLVSMNMWGVTPEYIGILEDKFEEFLQNVEDGDLKAEFLLPIIMDDLLKSGQSSVKVLSSSDRWFGVTYQEDKDSVVKAFEQLVADGVYSENLWAK